MLKGTVSSQTAVVIMQMVIVYVPTMATEIRLQGLGVLVIAVVIKDLNLYVYTMDLMETA